MGCIGCRQTISGVCKVCSLLDGDNNVKIVTYCDTCEVYICKQCNSDLIRRFKAYLKAKL